MATPHERLATSLEELRRLQADGARVFASSQLDRTSRERLVKAGFLQEVMRGWLISASPIAALETASVEADVRPFARFIARQMPHTPASAPASRPGPRPKARSTRGRARPSHR